MITKVRPQGGLSVRYIWLHMATCIMGPKADDGTLRAADDAHFQQTDDNGRKRWTHVHRTKGVWWALTAVENFKGFVDSRRIAATFNDLRKWQVSSSLTNPPSHRSIATYNDCHIRLLSPVISMTTSLNGRSFTIRTCKRSLETLFPCESYKIFCKSFYDVPTTLFLLKAADQRRTAIEFI